MSDDLYDNLADYVNSLTPEQIEENKRKWDDAKVKKWDESYCNECPLATEKTKQRYLQLGAFACDDPMGKIFVISQTYPVKTIERCNIAMNIHNLYNIQRLEVDKLKEILKKYPKLKEILKVELGDDKK